MDKKSFWILLSTLILTLGSIIIFSTNGASIVDQKNDNQQDYSFSSAWGSEGRTKGSYLLGPI